MMDPGTSSVSETSPSMGRRRSATKRWMTSMRALSVSGSVIEFPLRGERYFWLQLGASIGARRSGVGGLGAAGATGAHASWPRDPPLSLGNGVDQTLEAGQVALVEGTIEIRRAESHQTPIVERSMRCNADACRGSQAFGGGSQDHMGENAPSSETAHVRLVLLSTTY
ncbi:hypothetical protein CC_1797 [Caulobacter vibrioides CB15]|uniref:Uncharacterized protein n=1 Tax=Caulobacter vibrioides (strain ATCC 19089 / CIP 103742 / CB 15) TaxID=190650 RepID=Q9A7C7_CAUVC|nr:hypothetical protein CC_1797 [Caulobacter vibrioides CB15]